MGTTSAEPIHYCTDGNLENCPCGNFGPWHWKWDKMTCDKCLGLRPVEAEPLMEYAAYVDLMEQAFKMESNGQEAIIQYRSKKWDDKDGDGWITTDLKEFISNNEFRIKPPDCPPVVNWNAMPAWGNWIAKDSDDSRWRVFTGKPSMASRCWFAEKNGDSMLISKEFEPQFSGDWKDSLTERPK